MSYQKIQNSLKCKICSSKDLSFVAETFNGHSQTNELHHFKCNNCGLVFVGDKITPEELGKAYSTLDNDFYYNDIKDENQKKMEYSIDDILNFCDKSSEIIDIGTGNGMFIELLAKAGFKNISAHEIAGQDLSHIKHLAKNIYQDFDYQTVPSESFDIITLLDVVEHVISPHYLLENCYRILKPGGYVYFHTPVVTRTDRLMHFLYKIPVLRKPAQMWLSGRTSIFHLQNYSKQSLEKLLKDCDFSETEIKIKNELSWSVSSYVRVYLTDKMRLPSIFSKILAPFFYPFLSTDLFNANKSIVRGRRI